MLEYGMNELAWGAGEERVGDMRFFFCMYRTGFFKLVQ